jgi:acyl-CoA hydrolase/GNAT superfamily N-acetyltransferase
VKLAREDEDVLTEEMKERYPEKFIPEERIFSHIHPGDRIFIGTGCGEPQYLVKKLIAYIKSNPKAFVDAEMLQVWNLGVNSYAEEQLRDIFRFNSFFIGDNARYAVNEGIADYTPIFLSAVPELFHKKQVPIDVALIQMSVPDAHGHMSLGISVDIVKAAAESAGTVIAQINARMPRVHGDAFLHISDIDFIVPHDEPLLEYETVVSDEIAERIGRYVARIVQDGDTIQVGYGSMPNAILAHLRGKKNLGVHTELLSDGIVDLMKRGVINNTRKDLNRDKTVAAFCMGRRETYEFIDDNPAVEFRPVSYTNNPLTIARNRNATAINSALEIDLTGQATAESLGKTFFSGIGGQADFMRGAMLSKGGKSILCVQSTAANESISRIVPFLREGAGVTLTRGDVHYVVSEYGIAYLHGKNIRERAMDLIAIAHPKFRSWLIEEAKGLRLIYQDQAFIPGEKGVYPEKLETSRTTKSGVKIFLRPVRLSDEQLLKEFFYSLSSDCMYHRFITTRTSMPHEQLQKFVVIDYTKEMVILASIVKNGREMIAGMAQYFIDEQTLTAEVAFVVRDDFQGQGIGAELLRYLTLLARRSGLHGFVATVLMDNKPMLQLFEQMGFIIERRAESGTYELRMSFRKE